MTVRWKPLLIMSGLFLVVAVVGVVVMTVTLVSAVSASHFDTSTCRPRYAAIP